MEALAF